MSYTVKSKSKGKKNVLMLTTLRPLNGKTKDDGKQKPTLLNLYDFTKGGTDIVDQLIDYYTTRASSRRWDIIAFYYILDTVRVNAKTVWCLSQNQEPQKCNTHQFAWKLASALVKPFMEQSDLNGLSKSIVASINNILGRKEEPQKQSSTCNVISMRLVLIVLDVFTAFKNRLQGRKSMKQIEIRYSADTAVKVYVRTVP